MRKGKSINTYSEIKFWPLDPRFEEIKVIDIAHALSLMCRGNGHTKHFYSVGQHSINCSFEAKNRGYSIRIQLACLLHDASEAYISDITRPVKGLLPKYLEIEKELQDTIYSFFGLGNLTQEEVTLIKEIDDAMLSYEMEVLFNNLNFNNLKLSRKYDLSFIPMKRLEEAFITILEDLIKDLH